VVKIVAQPSTVERPKRTHPHADGENWAAGGENWAAGTARALLAQPWPVGKGGVEAAARQVEKQTAAS